MRKYKDRLQREMEKPSDEYIASLKMQNEIEKYGHKITGGHMWTISDMQKYFNRKKR